MSTPAGTGRTVMRICLHFLSCCVMVVLPGVVSGADFPLWEAGLGVGVISLPDYRGSDERSLYVLPVPYLVYRGDILKVDRRSIRGLLFQNDLLDIDVSFNAAPPVDSKKNSAREGMPDLDPTGEVGPSLVIKFGESGLFGSRIAIQVPIRIVVATDLTYLKQVGYVFNPRLNFAWPIEAGNHWNAGLTAGPLFTDNKLNDFYYEVEPAFATPNRPVFAARGGYAGFQVTATVSRRFENMWFGAFVRVDDLHGAVFRESPLVKSLYGVMGGFSVSWVFDASATRATADE